MLVCYTSDLHGQPQLYDQLGELVLKTQPRLLILGGDLLTDGDESDPVGGQIRYVEQVLLPRLDDWRHQVAGLEIALLPGNHDWSPTTAAIAKASAAGRVTLLTLDTAWRVDHTDFVGYHCTPWTPHWVKCYERRDMPHDPLPEQGGQVWDPARGAIREVSAAAHFGKLPSMEEELAAAPHISQPWVFVCHAPPRDSQLDRLPQLDFPIGSVAVRRFIEQRQPKLALHGHVHEAVLVSDTYHTHIGQTLCVNPGQSDDRLHAVTFELEDPEPTLQHTVYG